MEYLVGSHVGSIGWRTGNGIRGAPAIEQPASNPIYTSVADPIQLAYPHASRP